MKVLIIGIGIFGAMVSTLAIWAIGFKAPVANLSLVEGAAASTVAGKASPVVLELFTSQGCSSCPPADKLLAELGAQNAVPGVEIIALSFHVDYWNRLGWADPYSSAEYSNRQRDYADFFQDNPYTPQLVVDGSRHLVGSSRAKAQSAIEQVRRITKLDLSMTAQRDGDNLTFAITSPTAIPADQQVELCFALTLDHTEDQVTSGENAGRKLAHHAVVQLFQVVNLGATGVPLNNTISIPASTLNDQPEMHAVVFLQVKTSREIIGASTVSLKGI